MADDAYEDALRLMSEGRTEEAREAFQALLVKQPNHAGAWLDLALLQCRLGMRADAESLFERIQRDFNPPPALRELIQRVRAEGCDGGEVDHARYVQLNLKRGRDSNANQGASNPFFAGWQLDPESLEQADNFTELGVDAMYLLPRYGTLLYAQLQSRKQDRLSDYDLSTLTLGIEQPRQLGRWDSRVGVSVGATRLGGELYQKQAGVHLQLTPPLSLPVGWRFNLVGDWVHIRYPAYESYDANVGRILGAFDFRNETTRLQGSLGATQDWAVDERPGGDKRGWSAALALRQRLAARLIGELSWTQQVWRGRRDYAPGFIDSRRHQRATLWRAAAIVPLDARHSLVLEYKDLDNRENVALFRYRSRQFMLGWQYEFGN